MKLIYIIVAVSLISACNNPDKPGTTLTPKSTEAALKDSANYTTIQWIDPVVQDLGKAKEGQTLAITWKFKNTGDKPLIIADVRPGCGCTLAEKPEQPIAAGAEGEITAKFDTKGRNGEQFKQVFVKANNKNKTGEGEDVLGFKVNVEKE
jgi:hypothetical protein